MGTTTNEGLHTETQIAPFNQSSQTLSVHSLFKFINLKSFQRHNTLEKKRSALRDRQMPLLSSAAPLSGKASSGHSVRELYTHLKQTNPQRSWQYIYTIRGQKLPSFGHLHSYNKEQWKPMLAHWTWPLTPDHPITPAQGTTVLLWTVHLLSDWLTLSDGLLLSLTDEPCLQRSLKREKGCN